MKELDQLLLNFNFSNNYKKDDFFVSKSNFFAFNLFFAPSRNQHFLLPGPSGTPDTYILRLGTIFNMIPADFTSIFQDFSIFLTFSQEAYDIGLH